MSEAQDWRGSTGDVMVSWMMEGRGWVYSRPLFVGCRPRVDAGDGVTARS